MACLSPPAGRRALDEATELYPRRNRASDGQCGDASHLLRASDHNPALSGPAKGYARAFDLTHDPEHGCDAHAMVRSLAERRDPRVKYIISQGRIWTPERGWRLYFGINRHDRHAHVSMYDWAIFDTRRWWWRAPAPIQPPAEPFELKEETMKKLWRKAALDPAGNGYDDVFEVREEQFIAAFPNSGMSGNVYGAKPANFAGGDKDGHLRVEIRDGPPGGQIDYFVVYADLA